MNYNKYTFIKSNNEDKVAENTLLIHKVYNTKDKIEIDIFVKVLLQVWRVYNIHIITQNKCVEAVLCCAGLGWVAL